MFRCGSGSQQLSGGKSVSEHGPATDGGFLCHLVLNDAQCSASCPFSRRTMSTTIQFTGRPMPLNRPWSST